MLKWLWQKLGIVSQKEVDYLIAENALLRAKVAMLERDISTLRGENAVLLEREREQQKQDSRAMESVLEQLDLLLLETLDPIGDA
tara:strand:+ start:261 stop:515 length:255 start_codon:yes stop_codon:yes gene_type:complete